MTQRLSAENASPAAMAGEGSGRAMRCFHDLGMTADTPESHREKSVLINALTCLKATELTGDFLPERPRSPATRRRSYSIERGKSTFDVPGRPKMKFFPMIAAGVQQPAGKPRAMTRSTMAKELKTVRE